MSAELQTYAAGVGNVVTELSNEEWLGPASQALASAIGPYVQWAQTTASQAEQNATSASSAAAAYEQVFASVVPPPVIALNRAQLTKAVATNILGQNNQTISQLESQYSDYWAQNTSALNNYQTQSSNVTSQLAPVKPAPQVTTGDGGTSASTAAVTNTSSVVQVSIVWLMPENSDFEPLRVDPQDHERLIGTGRSFVVVDTVGAGQRPVPPWGRRDGRHPVERGPQDLHRELVAPRVVVVE